MRNTIVQRASAYFEKNIDSILQNEEYLYKSQLQLSEKGKWSLGINELKWLDSGKVLDLPEFVTVANRHNPTMEVVRKLNLDFRVTHHNNKSNISKILILKCQLNERFEILNIRLNDKMAEIEEEFSGQIYQIYDNEKLECLSLKSTRINGLNTTSYFSNMVSQLKPFRENSFRFSYEQELTNCTKDIKYHLGQLILYSKLQPIHIFERAEHNPTLFKYFPNRFTARYLQNANTLYEKTYNYWDALGDTLDYYLKTDLQKRQITFAAVIDALNQICPSLKTDSIEYRWLLEFRQNEYKTLNSTRIKIVHYFNLETMLFEKWLKNNNNESKIELLQDEFNSYVNTFKEHLRFCLKGYEVALKLINEYQIKINK